MSSSLFLAVGKFSFRQKPREFALAHQPAWAEEHEPDEDGGKDHHSPVAEGFEAAGKEGEEDGAED